MFEALGDPHRQRILLMFEPGEELTVGQIVAASTLSRSAVAHHLKVLREAGVLHAQKVGKEVWYRTDPQAVRDALTAVMDYLATCDRLWINPRMERLWQPQQYVQRMFYMNAGCVARRARQASTRASSIACSTSARRWRPGFRALLFAFDWARDDAGRAGARALDVPRPRRVRGRRWRRAIPQHFEWAASIHPYDPRALDRLDAAAARGARAVKWLPSAQNIDPASPRCDRFYAKLAALRLPLITHAGDERAVRGFGEHLGNPLRLRRPLDAGVRVVVAHCASLGMRARPRPTAARRCVAELRPVRAADGRAALSREPASATSRPSRRATGWTSIATLLARRDWHPRLLNGSDYPLPGVLPLISLPGAGRRAGCSIPPPSRRCARSARPQRAAVRLRAEAQPRAQRRGLRARRCSRRGPSSESA